MEKFILSYYPELNKRIIAAQTNWRGYENAFLSEGDPNDSRMALAYYTEYSILNEYKRERIKAVFGS